MTEEEGAMTYQVKLTNFTGPVDLLLKLIENNELDIFTICLADLFDDYLAHIKAASPPSEELADYLKIAASLLLIKAQRLLPPNTETVAAELEEATETEEELRWRILQHQRFKLIMSQLETWQTEGNQAFRREVVPEEYFDPILETVPLEALTQAFQEAIAALPPKDEPDLVPLDDVTLETKVKAIKDAVEESATVTFQSLMAEAKSLREIVMTFLALLELIKQRKVHCHQKDLFGPILVSKIKEETGGSGAD